MKSADIRERFLKFFEEKGHKRLPGSSLIPSDPTVLLTLAGMLQFKPVFLGKEKPKHKRATTVQKCIRMNDIAQVGKTSRHHTFFEMLGNFSFGDYFKREAIIWAWELITKELKVPADRLFAAVYEKDDESYDIWKSVIGLQDDRIVKLGEDNNFWAAGPTGPCGPCSEIYYDMGAAKGCGRKGCGPGCECDRFLEIWNLVFIQYDRDDSGKLNPLPSKNIDTGMGLERIASVLQGKATNFDTDLFMPIISSLREMVRTGSISVQAERGMMSERIIADHIRAATHLIADGVLPSNEGRGYVLRNLIRRAVRHGRILGLKDPFLCELSRSVISVNGAAYPEIVQNSDFIHKVLLTEEDNFSRTLEQGMTLIAENIKKALSKTDKTLSGKEAFILHDTYGFPYELTKEIAMESGVTVDDVQYIKEMEQQKQKARTAGIGAELKERIHELSKYGPTRYLGYSDESSDAKVVYVDEKENLVVLDRTPFYPEGGGQVGDAGRIMLNKTDHEVIDAFGNIGGVIVHELKDAGGLRINSLVKATVDRERRAATAMHHTSTHLLQASLRELFGRNVRQTGSFVSPDRFRFDFTYFGEISKENLEMIEKRVNEKIKEKLIVTAEELSLEEARKRGAIMLFDEKYGEKVRVISVKGFSMELCAGIHVKNTSDISIFKIISEGAVSAGVRRIEAKAGDAARAYLLELAGELLNKNKQMFDEYESLELKKGFLASKPDTYYQFFRVTSEEMEAFKGAIKIVDIPLMNRLIEDFKKKNTGLQERVKDLQKEARKSELENAREGIGKYEKDAVVVGDIKLVFDTFRGREMDFLRDVSDSIRGKIKRAVCVLFSVNEEKVSFVLSLSKELVDEGYDANKIARESAKVISGGGGGRPHIAEAGGSDPSKIDAVKEKIIEIIKRGKQA